MHFTSIVTSAALLVAAAHAQQSIGNINGTNSNGVATYDGYTCSGAIYVGCDNNVNNAFCCVGAYAQQNICNSPQPTTCSQGSYVPLTQAGSAAASSTPDSTSPATVSAQSTAASGAGATGSSPTGSSSGGSSSGSSSTASAKSGAAANLLPQQLGAGMLAVVVKVLFL